MGAMIFLMYIKNTVLASSRLTYDSPHTVVIFICLPSVENPQFFQPLYSQHIKKCKAVGYTASLPIFVHLYNCYSVGKSCQLTFCHLIKIYMAILIRLHPMDSRKLFVDHKLISSVIQQLRFFVSQGYHCERIFLCICCYVLIYRMPFQQRSISNKQHNVSKLSLLYSIIFLFPVSQNINNSEKQVVH